MTLLNGPLENGIRALTILEAVFPESLDISRLTIIDHCALHSSAYGGPVSIHPDRNNSVGELSVKRKLMSGGLRIMGNGGMIEVKPTSGGIAYQATNDASGFLNLLESSYVSALRDRASWAVDNFLPLNDHEVRAWTRESIEVWRARFDAWLGEDES
ncbi:ABC-three component system middle component 2 [Glutamicibacter sp.]|uniref:ABC-three component system middle component 2 n=1 Tax=Glutamicibacter sp. TaxID=1931995 RepID=UPI002B48D144|nr:ABC-three component system middle component 2 [Glutamicibacter sp.]HJX78143.1 ABC-three component system middle component 2 [Glutamicibacter sp.]